MFWIITWLAKIALSPIKWVAKVIEDISWSSDEWRQLMSIWTLWISSLIEWTAKGIKGWADDIFDN